MVIDTKGAKLASKSRKEEYTDLEKEIDIEEFRESVLNYFSTIPDPRRPGNLTYKLEHIFFIILDSAVEDDKVTQSFEPEPPFMRGAFTFWEWSPRIKSDSESKSYIALSS